MGEKKIVIFTDGSCLGNPGPGGWGAIIFFENKKYELTGGAVDSTNNRMEMTAIIKALQWVHENLTPKESNQIPVEIYSDSNLIIQTINSNWKRKANTDLWQEMDDLRSTLKIRWQWVKAHANNNNNNSVDKLAFESACKYKRRR